MDNIEEITLILTRQCNLKCKFCNIIYDEKHRSTITVDDVVSNYQTISEIIKHTSKSTINIVLMGGELFSDDISDDIINSYEQLLLKTYQCCLQHNKRLTVSLMSNLITKNVDRIIKLAKSLPNCDIHGSYDFVGRFDNEKLIDLWWNNATKIKHSGIDFFAAVVGHKYNVQAIVNGNDQWDRLYDQFGVYVQYYEPNQVAPDYNLSFEQYRHFLLFLYDEYPQEKFLRSVINAYDHQQKTCCQSNWIDSTGCHKCCSHQSIIKIYKHNHNCFVCKHHHRCPIVCPRVYHQDTDCIFQSLFDHHLEKCNGN